MGFTPQISSAYCNRLNQKFRLTKTSNFQRVRQNGKSYAHPLVVLITQPNGSSNSKVAISASRSVGNAVQRNKAKRKIREIIRSEVPQITPGWDILILARQRISGASFLELKNALDQLLTRASLKIEVDGKRLST